MTNKSQLYTRTGDNGTTALVGGQRIAKDAPRLEAYGTIDECNSWIGLVAAYTTDSAPVNFHTLFIFIQKKLFDIGGYLATDPTSCYAELMANPVTADDILRLEHAIDAIDASLPKVNSFILPGGSIAASQTHIARTVCRRAERRIITLATQAPVDPLAITFVNRLSDLLFAIARFNNIKEGGSEIFWTKDC